MKLASIAVLVIIALLIAYFLFRGDSEPASAEARFDGVHLCSPEQQSDATTQALTRETPEPAAEETGLEPPLFAQNDPAWGGEEYDSGGRQTIGCGRTIAQCGCAMTSVASVMQLFNVVTTPEGDLLDPSSLNARFNQGAQLTADGWVSQGYVFGNVVWTAINGWSPETSAADDRGGESANTVVSTERDPAFRSSEREDLNEGNEGPPSVRFKGWGSGAEAEIRRELQAGRPVVIEVPGHFVAAVGLDGDEILINDPFYRDRRTLSAYKGLIKSSRLFERSDDLRSLMISVPAGERVRVTDNTGRAVGVLEGDDPLKAQDRAAAELPGASYRLEEAWRDPTCSERPPPPGSGVNTIFIPAPETGIYTVEVLNLVGDDTSAAVHMSNLSGMQKMEVHEGGTRLIFEIDYDSGSVSQPPLPTQTPTATPTSTETPLPTAPATPDSPTVEATPTPVVDNTATASPLPPTATATSLPAGILLAIFNRQQAYIAGDSVILCYSVSRPMQIDFDLISPDGLRFNFIQGMDDGTGDCLSFDVTPATTPGTWEAEIIGEEDASSSTSFLVQAPTPTPTPTPVPMSIESFTVTETKPSDCSEDYYATISWFVGGDPQGTITITRRLSSPASSQVIIYSVDPGVGIAEVTTIVDKPSVQGGETIYEYRLNARNSAGVLVSQLRTVALSKNIC